MNKVQKKFDIDWDYIGNAFRELLNFCKKRIRELFRWIERNPEKVAIIMVAVAKAFSGDYQDLIDVGFMLISA